MRAKLVLTALVVVALEAVALRGRFGAEAFELWGTSALFLAALGVALVLAVALRSVSRLLARITEVEIALLELARGERPTPVELHGDELDGLAHRVNMLRETPRTEPSGTTAPSTLPRPATRVPADDSELAARLDAEGEDAYLLRTFDEYVAAKRALGEDASGIDRDRFTKGLLANAERHAKKVGCTKVRFVVRAEGQAVSLDPVVLGPRSPG